MHIKIKNRFSNTNTLANYSFLKKGTKKLNFCLLVCLFSFLMYAEFEKLFPRFQYTGEPRWQGAVVLDEKVAQDVSTHSSAPEVELLLPWWGGQKNVIQLKYIWTCRIITFVVLWWNRCGATEWEPVGSILARNFFQFRTLYQFYYFFVLSFP